MAQNEDKIKRLVAACAPFVNLDECGAHYRSTTRIGGEEVPCETGAPGNDPKAEWYTVYPTREQMDELRAALADINL